MSKRHGMLIPLAMVVILLIVICSSCGKSTATDSDKLDGVSAGSTDESTLYTADTEDVGDLSEIPEADESEDTAALIFLKNGDTGPLVGFAFGDEMDYDQFDAGGYVNGECQYRLKTSEDAPLYYLFDEKSKGFYGLAIYWEGSFFGIDLGRDTLEKLVSVYGDPDTYQEIDGQEGMFATWHFEKADLRVKTVEEKIRSVEYRAAEEAIPDKEKPEALTDFGTDRRGDCDEAEDFYNWEACGSVSNGTYAVYHPYNEDYDESQREAFVGNYLISQRISKKTPDGVSYNDRGYPLVEYYVDKAKNQYCFVVHLWADYWIDYEKGESKYRDAIYCTTYIPEHKAGSLIYNYDTAQGRTRERLYDAQGKRMADMTYEYVRGVSFPFITDYWNLNTGYELIDTVLCRNQKTWFYKEQAEFDEAGRFIRYKGNINKEDRKEYLPYPCSCVYSADGRLEAVKEDMQAYDVEQDWGWWDENVDYSGRLKYTYDDNGIIETVDYIRSSYSHGTTDSSGVIKYDEKGRMIYNEYYITHGSHINIFLYEEGAERPWACFYWCSFAPGFENVYLFRPADAGLDE